MREFSRLFTHSVFVVSPIHSLKKAGSVGLLGWKTISMFIVAQVVNYVCKYNY